MNEPDPVDTEFLAQAAQTGDLERFNQLHERLAASLCVWAERSLGSGARRQIDPRDLVQDVWVSAHRALGRYDADKGSFRAWLFGVAKNCLLRMLREAGRRSAEHGHEATGGTTRMHGLQQIPHSVTALVHRVARADDVRLLLDYIATLDAEDRELVMRCGIEGGTASQVAAAMHLGEEAVTKRWQRLRKKLLESPSLQTLVAVEVDESPGGFQLPRTTRAGIVAHPP